MRVYGALMWSLGKVVKSPEVRAAVARRVSQSVCAVPPPPQVVRVYIGSFWDRPYVNSDCAMLMEAEQRDLLTGARRAQAVQGLHVRCDTRCVWQTSATCRAMLPCARYAPTCVCERERARVCVCMGGRAQLVPH